MRRLLWAGLLPLLLDLPATAAETPLQKFLETHCVRCHDKETKKGGLDLTSLSFDLSDRRVFDRWVMIHDRVQLGEMPPKKRLDAKESRPALEWLSDRLVKAEQARTADGRAVYRRLTRTEFEHTMQDLFDLPGFSLKEDLPADGMLHGFNKVSAALDISHVHLARYMDTAKRVLDVAIATLPTAPKVFKKRLYPAGSGAFMVGLWGGDCVLLNDKKRDLSYPLLDKDLPRDKLHYYIQTVLQPSQSAVGVFRHTDDSFQPAFQQFQPILSGRYRIRLSIWSFWWDQGEVRPSKKTQVASLRTTRGNIGNFDAPSLDSKIHEIETWLEPGDTISFNTDSIEQLRVYDLPGRAKKYQGPGIAIDWLEVEGPMHDTWPPKSHVRLFGNLLLKPFVQGRDKNTPAAPGRMRLQQRASEPKLSDHGLVDGIWTVTPSDPQTEAEKLFLQFLPKAFRRPVTEAQIARYRKLVSENLGAGECCEESMRSAYQAALCSPEFLFHLEPKGRLDDWAIAARLSYLLWNSIPDDVLLDLAAKGQLKSGGETLRGQVQRMLRDPRANRFFADFLGQWLSLYDIAATSPDKQLYPEFILYMQDCMVGETQAFFQQLLLYNLGIRNLIDSDFAMLNAQLGKLYGLAEAPAGHEISRVLLPPDSHRGGLLTQASILKITANGTTTSPVKRGAWIMDRLLGKPPKPPPPNITGLEPDVRGTTTIRDQLARHRNQATCTACHRRIDPPGFALENYDVIGRWRDRYRTKEKGEHVNVKVGEGHYGVAYKLGPPVDSSGETAEGAAFKDIEELKKLLLQDERQLARNFIRRLLAYGTGKEAGFADRPAIERILDKCGKVSPEELTNFGTYRMGSLLEELVLSDLFLTK